MFVCCFFPFQNKNTAGNKNKHKTVVVWVVVQCNFVFAVYLIMALPATVLCQCSCIPTYRRKILLQIGT